MEGSSHKAKPLFPINFGFIHKTKFKEMLEE